MAANFWTSTHYRHWLHPAAALSRTRGAARAADAGALGLTPPELAAVPRTAAAFLTTAARRANLRARVASTAAVYFARFYTRTPYAGADPRLLAPVALYLAAKAEEHTVPAKTVVAAAAAHYTPSAGGEKYPYTVADVVRAEFTLASGIHFDLIVWSPHRDLAALTASGGGGGGGGGGGVAHLTPVAWAVLNDAGGGADVLLLFPPFVLAAAALVVAGCLAGRDMRGWVGGLGLADAQGGEVAEAAERLAAVYVGGGGGGGTLRRRRQGGSSPP
ncbi:hypothetical protein BU14_0328s0032 [Porphyra umbilicalis]|uniref:Cyclin-like domain-containing protein n=1 Tax=Porphyra umbilicalis TaxID=2786 RepID=A0A1X6NZ25_PORUM|nr:hypothetical protein BU14_0328s0032 [Porphyra umbilicalis]|eukprot:OSX73780.1 hypothetical protein BU14_0328s0032 [Porphyra umbilicalis]